MRKFLQLFKKKAHGKKGFTLVELVIVIAVLAIVAAIAIPTVNGVVANANSATDESNKQAVAMTIKTFQAESEAQTTHPFEVGSAKEDLVSTSTITELFAAYGMTIPVPKIDKTHKFFWNTKNQTVTIAATAPTDCVPVTGTEAISTLGII